MQLLNWGGQDANRRRIAYAEPICITRIESLKYGRQATGDRRLMGHKNKSNTDHNSNPNPKFSVGAILPASVAFVFYEIHT